jgi:DEAD/DEAH box helicase domain-containing protein
MAENSPAGKLLDSLPEKEQGRVLQKLATLVRNVAPVFLLCDLRDIRVAERFKDPAYDCCSIYVYDSYPGGTGLSEGLVRRIADILNGCRELVESCSCEAGCPSCVGPTEGVLHFNPKQGVKEFLAGWL